ncbi:MAG: XdhC family protein, partial [Bacteroidota bacterium]
MKIWNFIKSKLTANHNVVLLIVIDSHGSSPGRKGFKMAVSGDDKMFGSVGGGSMEYKLVQLAKKQFIEPEGIFSKVIMHTSLNDPDDEGMICSGSQHVAFYPINKKHLPLIKFIADANEGELFFTETGFDVNPEVNLSRKTDLKINDERSWYYTEHLGIQNYLYIIGAGHVSISVSRLFKQLGFYITVFDNRNRELTTFKNNRFAHSKKIIDYERITKHITEGDNVYVAIMTFNHADDGNVLRQLINKNVKYLGMMGSAAKVSSVFNKLKSEGLSEEQLKKVDAPIGFP